MGEGSKVIRVVLVFLMLILSVFQALFFMYQSSLVQETMQANVAQGTISMCINYRPTITGVCSEEINQSTTLLNNTYTCQLTATTDSGYSLTYSYLNITDLGVYFSMNSSGFVTIWANDSAVGSHTTTITVQDTSDCPAPVYYFYTFEILNINDPPVLIRNLPSKDIAEGKTIVAFFLRDYFSDPDGDVLNYSVTESVFTINVDPPSTRVLITAPGGFCGEENVYFTATDPYGLFIDSNVVTLQEICQEEGGGGGGGGGGSSRLCEPEWDCRDWSKCFVNGTQFRTCVDLHGCDLNNLKREFWRECNYTPTCYDGIQNQGELGIDCGGPCAACMVEKEPEKEKEPTCDDGIRNQGEIGVDCGGPCPVCKRIEVPGLLPEDEGNELLTTIMIIVFAAGALALIYAIFRKEIKMLVAKIAWWLTKRKRKQILLTDIQREELITSLNALDVRVRKAGPVIKSTDRLYQETMRNNRLYLNYALKSPSFYEDELDKALKVVKNADLAKAIKMFVNRQTVLETGSQNMPQEQVIYYIQELRQLVINTSNYERKDFSFSAREVSVSGTPLERCHALLYNATVALEFSSVEPAQNYYFELLKIYELLNEKEKGIVFYEIAKTFRYIRYVLSWMEKK
ncbi:MAG: Ig-like domain-containing protein [Candidatus Nanoarchaeia archaeon]